ncbi:hypothetical protein [Hydrogenobacter thermophilus]|uniref:hypothetical protein n=1 Tax=Hydrogenobacter thermophilus TaxID=940 RepID=UPI0030F75CA2
MATYTAVYLDAQVIAKRKSIITKNSVYLDAQVIAKRKSIITKNSVYLDAQVIAKPKSVPAQQQQGGGRAYTTQRRLRWRLW